MIFLVGVDLESSLGCKPDLSPETIGVERYHEMRPMAQWGWHPYRRLEGKCSKEGVPATSAPSILLQEVKKSCKNCLDVGMDLQKVHKQRRAAKLTRRLPYYENMVEKRKGRKLPCICYV